MMNITFDYYHTCPFKDVRPGDVFSIGNYDTVYIRGILLICKLVL